MKRFLPILTWALLCVLTQPARGQAVGALGWFELPQRGPSVVGSALESARSELEALALHWVSMADLLAYLQEQDHRAGVLREAGRLLQEGRELHLGLKLNEAVARYQQAAERLESGFARYYEPGRLAEPLLQLGAALFQSGRRDEARKAFMRVGALAPQLQLAEGYYSPSVRAAFAEARAELGELQVAVPTPAELARICRSAHLAGLVVASSERLGDRPLLRLALFDARRTAFVAVETAVVIETEAARAGRDVAERLRGAVASVAGLVLAVTAAPDGGTTESPDGGVAAADEGGGEPPWYWRHWWIWPVVAVALGAAVAVPVVVLREDVIDVRVHTR